MHELSLVFALSLVVNSAPNLSQSDLPEHAQRLASVRPLLLSDLDAALLPPLVDLLVAHGEISPEEEEEALHRCCRDTRSVQWRRMLSLLAAKPPSAYAVFRHFLAQNLPGLAAALDDVRVLPQRERRPEDERRWEAAVRAVCGSERALRLWRMLSRWMDLEEGIIRAVESEIPTDSMVQCAEALRRWRKANDSDIEEQLVSLERSLRRLEITSVAEEVSRL